MNRLVSMSVMCLVIVLGLATTALAQAPAAPERALIDLGAAFGRLAGAALESMARQPEVAGSIQTAMIIAAALIEGFTFYALYICSTAV